MQSQTQCHPQGQPQSLSDRDLLNRMQFLVQRERELLTEILHHLKEVERRKLYSDLGYKNLFDYVVRELNYSEGQAGRRIQAMRLLRQLPEEEARDLEEKIESGALNLSNICQAQSFFYQLEKSTPDKALNMEEKIEVLRDLEHKSARQGQMALLRKREDAGLEAPSLKERERALTPELSELRLVLSAEQMARLEEVRSLLGQKAMGMSWAEVIGEMANLSISALKDKKFGKRRGNLTSQELRAVAEGASPTSSEVTTLKKERVKDGQAEAVAKPGFKPCQKAEPKPRSISKGKRYRVWERDGGACLKCGSKESLQVDHIVPVARGGGCGEENLRLLCMGCNVREGVKEFGLDRMRRAWGQEVRSKGR